MAYYESKRCYEVYLFYKLDFSVYTITNLRKNKRITINTLEKLCKVLEFKPNDIIEFSED